VTATLWVAGWFSGPDGRRAVAGILAILNSTTLMKLNGGEIVVGIRTNPLIPPEINLGKLERPVGRRVTLRHEVIVSFAVTVADFALTESPRSEFSRLDVHWCSRCAPGTSNRNACETGV